MSSACAAASFAPRPFWRWLVTSCVLLGFLAPSGLAASSEWYEHYDKAESALAAENWSEALRELNFALELKQQSGARVRTYGMRFVAYFPFLKLGIAYFQLGQPEAALQALETELSQGEIARSPRDLALLESYRQRIKLQHDASEQQREERARSIVTSNLAAAHELEQQGKLEDALVLLGRVLAVAPHDPAAIAAQRRLLSELAVRNRRRDDEQQVATLLRDGKSQLAAQKPAEAAVALQRALELDPTQTEARTLLDQAHERLRAGVGRAGLPAGGSTVPTIEQRLAHARESSRAGHYPEALGELQTVLALDPKREAARELQGEILRAQRDAEQTQHRDAMIAQQLLEAGELLAAGRPEEAQRAANRALVLDPANTEALRLVTRAYARLSESLLATDTTPPTIVLNLADGTAAVHSTDDPAIVLTGSVYDNGPSELMVTAGGRAVGKIEVSRQQLQGLWVTEFTWRHRVAPGQFTVDLTAVDPAGNRTTRAVTTEYVVPLVRSTRLYASIVAFVGLCGAGLLALRIRRRRRLLRQRFNPYTAGAPILEQQRFFGRQQLLEYVLRRVANNSIMLYGERRIGKTSFQHQLKRCLMTIDDPHHEFHPVYVDLQGIPQQLFFATLAAEIFQELAPKLGNMQPTAPVGHDSYEYREFVVDLHRVLDVLRKQSSKKVKLVLLIDEVDELNDYDPRVNQRLRSLFMRGFADSLVAVVSGVAIKKQWDREGSPWYNFFQEVEVQPLDSAEARALIEAPVRGIFTFEAGAADEIIRRTTSKPYLIQRLCAGLVDRLHDEQRDTITLADVEAGCQTESVFADQG